MCELVPGERIRDKIAASKKKGLWMGGPAALRYRIEGKKLVIEGGLALELVICGVLSLYARVGTEQACTVAGAHFKVGATADFRLVGDVVWQVTVEHGVRRDLCWNPGGGQSAALLKPPPPRPGLHGDAALAKLRNARSYKAPPGCAIVFSAPLLHAVSRVTKGRRYAFLPFVYDEAAANVRAANNAFLGEGIPRR